MTRRSVVERIVRTDEILFQKEDFPADNVAYYGRTANFNTADSAPLWQIKQISYVAGIVITRFARGGAYNCKWADRVSLFPAVPPGPPFPTDPVQVGTVDTYPGKVLEATTTVTVGPEVTVLTAVVPGGVSWRLRYAEIACRGHGRWRLLADGVRIAGGVTSALQEHDRVELPGFVEVAAGKLVELKYTYSHGPAGLDIDAFLGLTEF